jgi:ABC-2 type transport system ATP-binding protein
MPLSAIAYETEPTIARAQASAKPNPVAALTNITKRYGNTLALDNLSLALHPGEVVALLGPNGAGKSTAIKLLLGLIAPSTGSARVFSKDPRHATTRTRVGAMLQVARVTEVLRVREHLDLFRSYYPAPMPLADVLRIAQLQGIEDRPFGQLSGGQRQRVLFALALCGNPNLIFLDEPTVGMDIEARRALWQEIRVLSALGKTVLLTTHYLEEADALADRIIVINKGRVIREGTPNDIKRSSGGRTIRCNTTLSRSFLESLPTVTNVDLTENAGDWQNTRSHAATITAFAAELVIRQMLFHDENLSNLEIANPGLEDAFLALTRNN